MAVTNKLIETKHMLKSGQYEIEMTVDYNMKSISLDSMQRLVKNKTSKYSTEPNHFVFRHSLPETIASVSELFIEAARLGRTLLDDTNVKEGN